MQMFELSRKYFSHALVIIDDNSKGMKEVNNNVVRALWGLIKVCKTIQRLQGAKDKIDEKNVKVLQIAQGRINEIYAKNTDMDVSKMHSMN